MTQQGMNQDGKLKPTKVTLDSDVRETVTRYVERQNLIYAPSVLSITRVVNEAVKEYVALRAGEGDGEEAAD